MRLQVRGAGTSLTAIYLGHELTLLVDACFIGNEMVASEFVVGPIRLTEDSARDDILICSVLRATRDKR